MNNNYSTTNNFYNENERHFHSHLVQYEHPKDVLLEGEFVQLYGMVLALIYVKEENRIDSVRIPLKGQLLEPMGRYSESLLTENTLVFLPEDKVLPAEMFKETLLSIKEEHLLLSSLRRMKKNGYKVATAQDHIEFKVGWGTGGFWIEAECLDIFIRTRKQTVISPKELENLCIIRHFLDKPFRFSAYDGASEKDEWLASEMNRMMDAYDTFGFHVGNGAKVYYDGTYTYNTTHGKKEMTPEEFKKKYVHSYKLVDF